MQQLSTVAKNLVAEGCLIFEWHLTMHSSGAATMASVLHALGMKIAEATGTITGMKKRYEALKESSDFEPTLTRLCSVAARASIAWTILDKQAGDESTIKVGFISLEEDVSPTNVATCRDAEFIRRLIAAQVIVPASIACNTKYSSVSVEFMPLSSQRLDGEGADSAKLVEMALHLCVELDDANAAARGVLSAAAEKAERDARTSAFNKFNDALNKICYGPFYRRRDSRLELARNVRCMFVEGKQRADAVHAVDELVGTLLLVQYLGATSPGKYSKGCTLSIPVITEGFPTDMHFPPESDAANRVMRAFSMKIAPSGDPDTINVRPAESEGNAAIEVHLLIGKVLKHTHWAASMDC